MKNKKKSSERLSQYLEQIDLSYWEEAFETDNAEKFRKLGSKPRGLFSLAPTLRRVIAACLCFLLITSAVALWPRISQIDPSELEETDPIETVSSGNEETQAGPVADTRGIKSMDMFNYYSAVKQLFGESALGGISTSPNGDAEYLPLETRRYAVDPNRVFYYTGMTFCRAELRDPEGFLAQQIGTGTIDVVIIFYDDPRNTISSMITFKNGDRYFSCMLDGANYLKGYTVTHFSTHKYMEGFDVVKDADRVNYYYNVKWNATTVLDITCDLHREFAGAKVCCDDFRVIPGSSVISYACGSITLAELERYYDSLHNQYAKNEKNENYS